LDGLTGGLDLAVYIAVRLALGGGCLFVFLKLVLIEVQHRLVDLFGRLAFAPTTDAGSFFGSSTDKTNE